MSSSDKQLFGQNEDILQYLAQSRLFGQLPEDLLQKLIPLSEIVQFSPGETILEEGAKNNKVYFLIRGSLSIFSSGEPIIELYRIGDIFGEMSVIGEKVCSATVVAKTSVTAFSLLSSDIGHFTELTQEDLQNILYRVFAKILTEKLLLTTHKAQQYESTNRRLSDTEKNLMKLHKDLEYRVWKRTTELEEVNRSLQNVILSHEQAEKELRKQETANRALLEAVPDTIFRVNKEGLYLDYIPSKNSLGLDTKEMIVGKNINEVLPIEVAHKFMAVIKKAFQTEETQFIEYQLNDKQRSLEYEARIVVSEKDNVLIIVRDITTRKRSEVTLEKQRHKLSQIFEDMKHFQHEILYIVASPPYCNLKFDSKKLQTQNIQVSIKALADYFNDDTLLRVHRSYLVNPKKVLIVSKKKHPDFEMWLKDSSGISTSIPVGRSYLPLLHEVHPEWFITPKRQKGN